MAATAQIINLFVYPIKGARGVKCERVALTKTGLKHDREFMVVRDGTAVLRYLSQRENGKLALVQPHLAAESLVQPGDVPGASLTVEAPGMPTLEVPLSQDKGSARSITVWEWTGTCLDQGDQAAEWFTEFLGEPCRLVRYVGSQPNAAKPAAAADLTTEDLARPVDPDFAEGYETALSDGFPMLLANQDSLDDLNTRLAASNSPEARLAPLPIQRFRPNILVKGLGPWAEDKYRTVRVTSPGDAAGSGLELTSVKPCGRCKVTTIDPNTGVPSQGEPLDILATFRKGTHLSWSVKSWKHAVHFGWNLVNGPEAIGRVLSVGATAEFAGAQKVW